MMEHFPIGSRVRITALGVEGEVYAVRHGRDAGDPCVRVIRDDEGRSWEAALEDLEKVQKEAEE